MKKERSYKGVYISLIVISAIFIVAISGFALMGAFYPANTFYSDTKINGINVGGMNLLDATNVLQAEFNNTANQIEMTFKYKEKEWHYTSKDFEIVDDFSMVIENAYSQISSSNIFDRQLKRRELRNNNGNISISYRNMLGGFNEKIDMIISEIEQELKEPEIIFDPSSKNTFSYTSGQNQISVNKQEFETLIDNAFLTSKKIVVYVPFEEVKTSLKIDDLKKQTVLRSEFQTSYKNSSPNRKSNVKTALSAFNGQIVENEAEISFNQTTGARTKENGYKPANIILNGVYVEGSGGGVCQASTTLYNALLLAGVEILEVSKHSLPASYVPLGLDAMVSEGVSDLKFKNNTGFPLYIKTWGDNNNIYVQIYGIETPNGEYYKTRSEFIRSIPHPGDRIVADTTGEYSNKVTFKGEYLRIKYPQEGYEAKAYLQKYSADGVLLEEILIRHETYNAQEGIIIEGNEEIYEGITLPENKVKFIPPQSGSSTTKENVNNKISGSSGEKYNP
ncbi:MAG: VanW family protein [Clostridia bacterium]|nr:VanW family protein [Clostridia bacterium]